MNGPSPQVALVFVATHERAFLTAALESLDAAPFSSAVETVVVDNASCDGTAEVIARRWPGVGLIRQGQRQRLPTNLNAGIEATSAPYVMLCNSDIAFRPHAIDRLANFLDAHPDAGVAGPKLVSPEGEVWPSARRWHTWWALALLRCPGLSNPERFAAVRRSHYADWDYTQPRAVDWVPCPATMVRREALDQVGAMDERFRVYVADIDLCLRMHEAGWEVWCVPEAEVVHLAQRASVAPLSSAWFSHLESQLLFAWKYKGLRPRREPAAPRHS